MTAALIILGWLALSAAVAFVFGSASQIGQGPNK